VRSPDLLMRQRGAKAAAQPPAVVQSRPLSPQDHEAARGEFRPERLGVILVAAGSSVRLGTDKIWASVGGKPILLHAVTAADAVAEEIVVVVKPGDEVKVVQALEGQRLRSPWRIARGGPRRQDSVRNGLRAIGAAEYIAVHDAGRPLATPQLFHRVWSAAIEAGAAVPGLPPADTIKRVRDGRVATTVERGDLRAIQTPQIFRRSVLLRAYDGLEEDDAQGAITDDASIVERSGVEVAVVDGEPWNVKVTSPGDVQVAAALHEFREAALLERTRS